MGRLLFTGGTVAHRDREVVGERSSGEFVERSFRAKDLEVKV